MLLKCDVSESHTVASWRRPPFRVTARPNTLNCHQTFRVVARKLIFESPLRALRSDRPDVPSRLAFGPTFNDSALDSNRQFTDTLRHASSHAWRSDFRSTLLFSTAVCQPATLNPRGIVIFVLIHTGYLAVASIHHGNSMSRSFPPTIICAS